MPARTKECKVSIAPGGLYSLGNASYSDTTDSTSVDAESSAMAELTLDVPDELMQRLQPLQDRLPALLTLLVDTISS